eukprot:scaffold392700_cov27-Prasinocladus_malaysianus.AAC.1
MNGLPPASPHSIPGIANTCSRTARTRHVRSCCILCIQRSGFAAQLDLLRLVLYYCSVFLLQHSQRLRPFERHGRMGTSGLYVCCNPGLLQPSVAACTVYYQSDAIPDNNDTRTRTTVAASRHQYFTVVRITRPGRTTS